MSQNQENQISDQELDSVSGGDSSNTLFSQTSSGGAGVKAKRSLGEASRNQLTPTGTGIEVTDTTFESY